MKTLYPEASYDRAWNSWMPAFRAGSRGRKVVLNKASHLGTREQAIERARTILRNCPLAVGYRIEGVN
jgi:hypothetical protein